MTDILFVGQRPDQYARLWRSLGMRNASLAFAANRARAMREIERGEVGAIVVDGSSLPTPAERVCRALRKHAPLSAIILIAESGQGSFLAVDCHLRPPVEWRQLAAALEKAKTMDRQRLLKAGDLSLDAVTRRMAGPRGEFVLPPKQCELLAILMQQANQVVPRPVLMQKVWHTSYTEDMRTLEVHISWLRRVIEPDTERPRYLVTKRGAGYVLFPGGRQCEAY